MLKNILQNLGFKDQEIDIFVQTASLGMAPASRIAQKTHLKRTTCYQVLEQLCQKKIIKKHLKSKMRYYEAIPINELLNLIKTSIDDLNLTFKNLENNKNELEKMYQKNIGTTTLSFYEGFEDIKQAYDSILHTPDQEIYSLTRRQFNINNHPLKSYWNKYLNERLSLKKMSYNLINGDDIAQPEKSLDSKKMRMTLKIPNNILPIFGDIKVSGNKLVIISQQEGRIFGVLIQNEELASMFKNIIKILWTTFGGEEKK